MAHWGLSARLVSPNLSDLALGMVMTVRSGRVTVGGMVLPAPFSSPHRAPPQGGWAGGIPPACLPGCDLRREAAGCWVWDWAR